MKHILAPLALFAAQVTVPAPEAGDSIRGCATDGGLYIITVRGTGEQAGIGVAGSLIGEKIRAEVKGTKIVALDYPASFTDPYYQSSVANGTKALGQLISEHVEECPNDKMAIIGYSQGAQVTLDTLCGTDETGFPMSAALASDKVQNHVVAIALLGDPTHVANATYNKGTSTSKGFFPRKNTNSCLKYANMISSWCDAGDVYCASGNMTAVHGGYFSKYGPEIVEFVVNKAGGKSSSQDNTSSSASSTGSATSATGSDAPAATTTSTTGAANDMAVSSRCLHVALPLTLAAMFQML